ncbi:hypothetical protein [Leifsonia sp. 1010]|uniref:hypothetical protein n=1 Tax=Leifsonia sp. 1010 TaxID=2817769 RepID=UPI00285A60F4|nr:hypothetical protein [Leifsonia sp. 1010]MDR6610904.1 hypothetical protein [Leifsonia sp. 1010]
MRHLSAQQIELEQKIRAHEDETAEQLATIRVLEEQWDDYRQVMRENTDLFEQAGIAVGADNYFVKRGLAARRELESYVGQLANEQAELFAETVSSIRSSSEEHLDRMRQEKAGA